MEKTKNYFINVRKKLPTALLAGLTPAFMYFFFGILEIFGNNRDEFLFRAGDFTVQLLFIALGIGVITAALIAFLPGYVSSVIFGLAVWVSVTGYLQSLLFNGGGSLGADVSGQTDKAIVYVNLAVWIITGIMFVTFAVLMKKVDAFKKILVILLIMTAVMSLTGTLTQIGKITGDSGTLADSDNGTGKSEIKPETAYLSTKGLTSVAGSKNVVIFLIDRFDISYYQDAVEADPAFFDRLDGFTFFSDNVSLYSRTYPAVTTMITGVDNDFSESAEAYFKKAYSESPFLKDLADNNFRIKLYTQKYYSYRSGAPLVGVADNIAAAASYRIADKSGLIGKLISLSAYRYLPNLLKEKMHISTASFYGVVETEGADSLFETDDVSTCRALLDNALTVDGEDNSYIFIHLTGCHYPFNMDGDCNYSDDAGSLSQLTGCFKMIYKYIDDLKALGLYDDSTLIITGDHPSALDDAAIPTQPRLTALFVKPEGSRGALKYSTAEVSQANLIPTITKSAGIKTEQNYGVSYFEVPEGSTNTRYHKFELYVSGESDRIVTLEVKGEGSDFANWKVLSETEIGYLYK